MSSTLLRGVTHCYPLARGRTRLTRTMMRLETERHPSVRYRGLELRLDLSQYPSQELYWLGSWEPRDMALIERHLGAGMVAVDAGANVGIFTCALAQIVGASGFVHAFEPDPSSFGILSANITTNGLEGRVALNRVALGDTVGETMLERAGASSFVGSGTHPVRVTTLDEYARGLDRLDFVKLDVEGYEPMLLRGAEASIGRLRPLLLVECAERVLDRNGSSAEDLRLQIRDLGYRVVDSGRENLLCVPM